MSKRAKVISLSAVGLGGLILALLIASFAVVQTDGFRGYVRNKIIASTEEATGGRVEVGAFLFDPRGFHAEVRNFVIHGKEPAGEAPFVSAARIELNFRLLTSFRHLLDITYLNVEQPRVNIIVLDDGNTNIPNPKTKSASDTTLTETMVNLAVGRFRLAEGAIAANGRKQAIDLRGNNLRAELRFNPLKQSYSGEMAMEPVYVVAGKNTPVTIRLLLPLTIDKSRVALSGAAITTPQSRLTVNGEIKDLRNPQVTAHVNGYVSLADVRNAGGLPLAAGRNVPQRIDVDANATFSQDAVNVTGLRLTAGQSHLEASGLLKDAHGQGNLQFRSTLALGELGRLARVSGWPDGSLEINGTAKLDSANSVEVSGNLQARNVSFVQSGRRFSNIGLASAIYADPHLVELRGLRLDALGGEFLGDVSLRDFQSYEANGDLRRLDMQTAARAFGERLPYAGVISGQVHVTGDAKASGTKGIMAQTNLSIAPGRNGISVTGKINVSYSGAADNASITNSYIQLPHTWITLDGALNRQLNVALVSRDLHDLLAAVPDSGSVPVQLTGGQASFNGAFSGSLANPTIAGRVNMDRFAIEGRAFQALSVDVKASSTGVAVQNGSLTRGAMRAEFDASAGLRNWSPLPQEPVKANVALRQGDLADVAVLAGQSPEGYSGALTADAHVQGTIGNPRGNADVQAAAGTLDGQPFDRAELHVNLQDRLIAVPAAFVEAGPQRLEISGEFQHPADSLNSGRAHTHVRANQVDLAGIRYLQKVRPRSGGVLQLDTDVTGTLAGGQDSGFLLTGLTAKGSAQSLRVDGQNYGDLSVSADTSGQTVSYQVVSNFAGSNSRISGRTQLVRDYPTTADADINRLPLQRVLALAGQSAIPARGDIGLTAHVSGTLASLQGQGELNLANAVIYGEPLDRVHLAMKYAPDAVEIAQLQVSQGPARIDASGRFDHPPDNFRTGNVQFQMNSTRIDLSKIQSAQKLRPGLGGVLQINAEAAAAVQSGSLPVRFSRLNADVEASGLTLQKASFGDLSFKASTAGGNHMSFAVNSNLAGAAIHGEGQAQITDTYPLNARLTFQNVAWSRLRPLLGGPAGAPADFEAAADGEVTVNGPLMNTAQLNGRLQLTKLELQTVGRAGTNRPLSIHNDGAIQVALENGSVRIENAHITGSQTDIRLTGTASLPQRTLNVALNSTVDLALLQSLSRDIVSSGGISATAAVRGSFSQPQINGQIDLKNASLNYATLPNGISNANGSIVFSGNSATIRSMTAESGGGKLTATGFAGLSEGLRFGVRVQASGVRSRVQQGVSIVSSADVRLTGTSASSVLSGNVTVEELNYAPQSDIGSILSRTATPVQSDTAPSPLLENMKLDIRVRTSPSLGVQASLAQNLQASADLRIRGTAAQPGVLGRVEISEGQLVFFGSTYTVNSGTIGFYDPVRITPVLNVSLETRARGVDVVLTVTGPIDNMKLSYTSDPPLQFTEIIGLLASGKTPTSDPTLLANEPSQPSQNFEQMGESAIVSKALADPVANRLQRVFGVTQLKIDPAFTSGSQLPTARLTFQQQITSHVTFTYTSALDDPNGTIIRAEWAFNPQYSAVATRDQNGLVSVLLYYKRQFR